MRSNELSAFYAQFNLRKRIRRHLAEEGLKHKDLANVLGIKQAAMSQRMTGAQWFTDSEVAASALYLSVEVDTLMRGSYYRQQAHQAWLDARARRADAEKEERRRRMCSVRALCCECGTMRLVDETQCGSLDGGNIREPSPAINKGRWVGEASCATCGVTTPHAVLADSKEEPDQLERAMYRPTAQQEAAQKRDELFQRIAGFNVDIRFRRMGSRKSRTKRGIPIIGVELDVSKSQWRIEINPDAPANMQFGLLQEAWTAISTDNKSWWTESNLTQTDGVWIYGSQDDWNTVADDLIAEIERSIPAERLRLAVDARDQFHATEKEAS